MGFLHSPLTIVSRLTTAVFISALPSCRTEISEDALTRRASPLAAAPTSPRGRGIAHNLHQAIFLNVASGIRILDDRDSRDLSQRRFTRSSCLAHLIFDKCVEFSNFHGLRPFGKRYREKTQRSRLL